MYVNLNEDKIPDLDTGRVIFIDQRACVAVANPIKMDLRARPARSCFALLPEVVLINQRTEIA
jgi:hypothetical protein